MLEGSPTSPDTAGVTSTALTGPATGTTAPLTTTGTTAGQGTTTATGALNTATTNLNGMGGMGMMDPYGSGMYGGMGGMYGGMGGMYGGMGGMYGGMGGMYGMGMFGMTPDAQRGQMMMFMISSMVQLWGMFSQVVQGTLGSVIQFVGNYVSTNQQMGQLEEDAMHQEEQYYRRTMERRSAIEGIPEEKDGAILRRHMRRKQQQEQPSWRRRLISGLIRHLLLLVAAIYLTKNISAWAAKRALLKARNVCLPTAGFGVGWFAFCYVDGQWLTVESRQKMNAFNLKVIRATQSVLPSTLVERYGYSTEFLDQMISSLEKGYTEAQMSDRFTFDEVLRECGVEDQLAYLEDHATENIPYFYIADVFHSWARIHEALCILPDDRLASDSGHLPLQDNAQFESEVLCTEMWKKLESNVIPFDVSIRALCVLAVMNKKNAKRIAASSQKGAAVVQHYKAYVDKLLENNTPNGDTVSKAEVTAATLFLLRAVNDVMVSKPLVPFLGRKTGPYPLADSVDPDVWCEKFCNVEAAISERTADSAMVMVDVLNEKLKCAERRLGGPCICY